MATKAKGEGNKCYKTRSFDRAVAFYKTGIAKMRSARTRKVPGAEATAGPDAEAAKVSVGSIGVGWQRHAREGARWIMLCRCGAVKRSSGARHAALALSPNTS